MGVARLRMTRFDAVSKSAVVINPCSFRSNRITVQLPIRNEEICFDDEPGFPHLKFGKGVLINNWFYKTDRSL
jgi:hypothetical protein